MASARRLYDVSSRLIDGRSLPYSIRQLGVLAPGHGAVTAVLIGLGIMAAIAESLGITLIVLLLHVASGGGTEFEPTGVFGHAIGVFHAIFGTDNRVLAVAIFLLIGFQAGLVATYRIASDRVGYRMSEKIRNALHRRLLYAPYDDFLRHERGDLLNTLATHSFSVATVYNSLVRIAVSAAAIVVFSVFLLAVSWQIGLMALVGFAVLSIGARLLARVARAYGARMLKINLDLSTILLKTLQGMRTIRSFGIEERQQKRLETISKQQVDATLKFSVIQNAIAPFMEVGTVTVLLIIVVVAGMLNISFAVALASVALLYRAQPRLRELDHQLLQLDELRAPLAVVAGLLGPLEHPAPPQGTRPFDRLAREIRFDRITVQFEGQARPALNSVSFTIPSGRRTAIVGPSGSGKTTLISLLLRLRAPSSGLVTADGVPLSDIERTDWLGHLAVAGQDVDLIDGSLRENILMGRPDALEAEVAEVLRITELESLAADLPDGLDTWIGEYGLQVSGGQRQRIGLARALLVRPKVLILDEAMNALDDDLEHAIRKRLWVLDHKRTLVVITHRVGTLTDVDHVILLSAHGSLVAEGPPQLVLHGRWAAES
ncbi:MAG: ABC transporter ATP-binding protein [Rhodospirillaceae bacterium]